MRTMALVMFLVVGCAAPPAPSPSPLVVPTPSARADCAVLGPLLAAAVTVQQHVDAGAAYSVYSDDVQALDAVYRKLDLGALRAAGGRCVDVGVMLEAAHNWHAQALAAWTPCVETAGNSETCIRQSVDPLLARARESTASAATALR